MSNLSRFIAYAAGFEEAYASDQWQRLAEHFHQDAVYEVGLPLLGAERCEGRDRILEWFADVVERFDRRFATRTLKGIEGPVEEGNRIWLRGAAVYTSDVAPDFELVLKETVHIDDGRIRLLVDEYEPEMIAAAEVYNASYGTKLGLRLGDPNPPA
jgi:hypothetical protein